MRRSQFSQDLGADIPLRGKSICKGLEVLMDVMCARNVEKASVTRAEHVEGSKIRN